MSLKGYSKHWLNMRVVVSIVTDWTLRLVMEETHEIKSSAWRWDRHSQQVRQVRRLNGTARRSRSSDGWSWYHELGMHISEKREIKAPIFYLVHEVPINVVQQDRLDTLRVRTFDEQPSLVSPWKHFPIAWKEVTHWPALWRHSSSIS